MRQGRGRELTGENAGLIWRDCDGLTCDGRQGGPSDTLMIRWLDR